MKALIFLIPLVLLTLGSIAAAHPAFALQHFFNCVTDAANKDGGDHNLTQKQVDDCFHKEFPNNPSDNHQTSDNFASTFQHIIHEHHFDGGSGASASASATAG